MNFDILRKHNEMPGAKKVFFVPINTGQLDLYEGFMANGFELYSLNFGGIKGWSESVYMKRRGEMDSVFLKACDDIRPDWVYMMLDSARLSPGAIKKAKKILPNAIFTNWTGDVRREPKPFVVELGKIVDITLIVSTGQLEQYRRHGLNRVEFLQAGIDTGKFFRMSEKEREVLRKELKHDVVFCAHNTTAHPGSAQRNEIGIKLSKLYGSRCALYGGGWKKCKASARGPIPYFDQNKVYNGSKIVISINNYNDIEMYFSARQLAAMGSGTITVSRYIPGLEKYFDNGHDLVWFTTTDECMKLVDYYLKNEDEARQIGINGAKKIQECHSRVEFVRKIATQLGFLGQKEL